MLIGQINQKNAIFVMKIKKMQYFNDLHES